MVLSIFLDKKLFLSDRFRHLFQTEYAILFSQTKTNTKGLVTMENTVTKEYAGLFTAVEKAIGELERIKNGLITAERNAEETYLQRTESDPENEE